MTRLSAIVGILTLVHPVQGQAADSTLIVNLRHSPVIMSETGNNGFTLTNRTSKSIENITFSCVTLKGKTITALSTFDPYPFGVAPHGNATQLSTGPFWQRDTCRNNGAKLAITGVIFSDKTEWRGTK